MVFRVHAVKRALWFSRWSKQILHLVWTNPSTINLFIVLTRVAFGRTLFPRKMKKKSEKYEIALRFELWFRHGVPRARGQMGTVVVKVV